MNLTPLAWQALAPQHRFSDKRQAVDFFDFQAKTKQAMAQYQKANVGTLFVLKTDTFPEYIQAIADQFTPDSVLIQTAFDRSTLFGYSLYLEQEKRIETVEGILAQANEKTLILPLSALLADISLWDKLKHALLFGDYQPVALNPIPALLPSRKTAFKLMLLGSREEIATLFHYDESLYQFGFYAEIENYLKITENNLEQWENYIQSQAQALLNAPLKENVISQLFMQYSRESESQHLVSISPTKIKKDLLGLANYYPNLTACRNVQDYFAEQEQQAAILNQFALTDMLNDQLYVETEGEEIGQINGLSVIEFEGVPYAFGEPLRISCNVQYGDGEITDIERKVELGGSLHAKGILLAESCLVNLLELPTQLPFSANLAFEQSYGEVDGDSSALAIFCVLVSALAKLPLPQSLAITGSIDQFGRVQSVGGVNQKIEGFFELCQARQLTGKQGVMIPTACISHLSLKPSVIEAVKAEQFHIWAVNDVFEAMTLLFNAPFYAEDKSPAEKVVEQKSNQSAIFDVIHQHLSEGNQHDSAHSWFSRLLALVKGN